MSFREPLSEPFVGRLVRFKAPCGVPTCGTLRERRPSEIPNTLKLVKRNCRKDCIYTERERCKHIVKYRSIQKQIQTCRNIWNSVERAKSTEKQKYGESIEIVYMKNMEIS